MPDDPAVALLQCDRTNARRVGEACVDNEPLDLERCARLDRMAVADRNDSIGRAVIPGGRRRHVHRRRGLVRLQHAAGRAAVGPRQDDLHLARVEADVVGEVPIAGHRGPGRHLAVEDLFANGARPRPRLGIGRQRHAEVVLGVALEALALEDLGDLVLEENVGRDGLVRIRRGRAEHDAATSAAVPKVIHAATRWAIQTILTLPASETGSENTENVQDEATKSRRTRDLLDSSCLVPSVASLN